MDTKLLLDLEKKVGEAVNLIAELRKEKENLQGENRSLKNQIENLSKEIKEYKSKVQKASSKAASGGEVDGGLIRKRLRKLAGKLAALEDSWN